MTTDKKWYEDKRAKGLKCWFSDGESDEVLDYFTGISNAGWMMFNSKENGNDFDNCRIAQGDKTPYDGKGQPVPDGVKVTIWDGNRVVSAGTLAQLSENSRWDRATHYQVQEMPEETFREKVIKDLIKNKIAVEDKTVQIKQSTINEIVKCLENARDATNELLSDEIFPLSGSNRRAAIYQEEIATIDKLIKELKDKQ